MSKIDLPDKPFYRIIDISKRWNCTEEDVMEYVRCNMLTVSHPIKDRQADLTAFSDETEIAKTHSIYIDEIFPIDGLSAILAFYQPDNGSISISSMADEHGYIEFLSSIHIHKNHLVVEKKYLDKFEEKYDIKKEIKEKYITPVSNKENENLLKTIGALASVIADEHGTKFKNNEEINVSQITCHVLNNVGENIYGIGKSSLNYRISKGLKTLKNAIRNA